jgi:hypothetical protein
MSFEPWAESLLRVLERATQTRPGDRYQRVQDFWEELSEASLPATQPLNIARAGRRISSDLSLEAEVITAAPPKPRFETSREIQHQTIAGNGVTRPKIVVPIAGQSTTFTNAASVTAGQGFAAPQQLGRVTVPVARNLQVARPIDANAGMKQRRRGRDFVVGVALVLCFAGLLVATGAYVRSWINQRRAQQQQPATPPSPVGRDALTLTDLNLRDGPSVNNNQIGLAEAGSKVRILNANNNWCEVQVLQHARPKDDPTSADTGWVACQKKYLKID